MQKPTEPDNLKYSMDGPFNDPVVRCDSCQKIILLEHLRKNGRCSNCGSIRVKNLQVFNGDELKQMEEWNVDPDFIKQFQEATNA